MLSLVKMREVDIDEHFSLRGSTLQKTIEVNLCNQILLKKSNVGKNSSKIHQEDKKQGLIPFYVSNFQLQKSREHYMT